MIIKSIFCSTIIRKKSSNVLSVGPLKNKPLFVIRLNSCVVDYLVLHKTFVNSNVEFVPKSLQNCSIKTNRFESSYKRNRINHRCIDIVRIRSISFIEVSIQFHSTKVFVIYSNWKTSEDIEKLNDFSHG